MTMCGKIGTEVALDNFNRGKILGYLRANPGTGLRELTREMDMGNGSISYHLQVLEKLGYVKSRKAGNRRFLYPAGYRGLERVVFPRREQELYDMIIKNSGCSQAELADALGVASPTVSHHLRSLLDKGLVRKEKENRNTRIYSYASV